MGTVRAELIPIDMTERLRKMNELTKPSNMKPEIWLSTYYEEQPEDT